MKKNNINIIKIGLNIILVLGLFCYARPSFAEGIDPYSYDNTRKLQPVLQESFLPPILRSSQMQRKDLPDAAPQAPALVTDADGNKFLYQDGQLLLKIDVQGNQTFYIKGQAAFERDYEGNITRKYEYSGFRATIKNEADEILGYREAGLGGNVLREYDSENTLIRNHSYDDRGVLEWVVDEITKTRTKYGLFGAEYELSPNGVKIAEYGRNGRGKLAWKLEYTYDDQGNQIAGKETIYDEQENPLYIIDAGTKVAVYAYDGHKRLKSITDQYGNVSVWGKHGVLEERDSDGNILVKHNWEGTRRLSSYDYGSRETTYYKLADPGQSDPYEPDYVLNNQSMKTKDYIYFNDIRGMDIKQIQAFLNITEEDAAEVYRAVQESINFDKSSAGLALIAYFEMTGFEDDGNAVYAYKLDIYNQYNKLTRTIWPLDDPNPRPY